MSEFNTSRMRLDVDRPGRQFSAAALEVQRLAMRIAKVNRHMSVCDGGLPQVRADGMAAFVKLAFDLGFHTRAVQAKYITAALMGAATLAVFVNVVELLCTAGLPALYTQILTFQQLPTWKNYLYLGLYNVAYMFDDSVMLTITAAVVALVLHFLHISDEAERPLWEQEVLPKIERCIGRDKVKQPRWSKLPETVSFILADIGLKGGTEALLSFWGEPFMARATDKKVPRFIFWVQSHSELVSRLAELARQVSLSTR